MYIDAGSPYNCAKIAIRYALGSVTSRPSVATINKNTVSLKNETEEFTFSFPELNYEYANKIALEDIPAFDQEEYGKFFYEYGRVLLANALIAITHLDWYAVGSKHDSELQFVSEYYDELLKLNQKVEEVLQAFSSTLTLDEKRNAIPSFDFLMASREILDSKNKNAYSSDAFDMQNTLILTIVYTGLWFSIIGYLLLFCQQNDVDGLSNLFSATVSKEAVGVFIRSLANSPIGSDDKVKICSLLFSFFSINRFYLLSSGLTIQDPLLDIVGKITFHFMDLIKDEEDLVILDDELIYTSERGVTIASFTNKYDPLLDIVSFSNEGIIKNDTANIWAFGKSYVRFYKERNEDESVSLFDFIEPCYIKYLEKYADISRYLAHDSIEIERSFLYLRNIITGLEKERLSVVCPGTILQLTLIAATYRTIEKESSFTRLSPEKKKMIQVGIDIADMLIAVLYQLWFYSYTFFIQPRRPAYSKNAIQDTLQALHGEVVLILEEYLEFVRFRASPDDPAFKEMNRIRYMKGDCISLEDVITKFHLDIDQAAYMKNCAAHENRTIVYSGLCEKYNHDMAIDSLASRAQDTPLDETIKRQLSSFKKDKDAPFTGIPIIDAVIDAYPAICSFIDSKPENYMIAVYTVLFDTLHKSIRKQTVGNYFDFGQADNVICSYKVESIVSELIRKPLQLTPSHEE
jgi:hypothetical protein